jgi:hypothetical protein
MPMRAKVAARQYSEAGKGADQNLLVSGQSCQSIPSANVSPPIQANQFSMRKDVVPHGLFLRGFVGIFQIRMPVIQSEKFVEMAMRANRRAWTMQTRSRRPNMMLI